MQPNMIQRVLCKPRHGIYRVRHSLGLAARTDSEAYYRLSRYAASMERFTPGEFRFAFGRMRFVDGPSLASQFQDIFIRRNYDFASTQPNPSIFDCGGNIGLSVIWFKQRYPAGRVVVFEADPALAQVLEQNLASFNLTGVQVVKAAVWTAKGAVRFSSDRADGGRVSTDVQDEVPSVRLADWITGPVDLLKVDIEGAEFDVLLDLCETGKMRHVQRLICEVHKQDHGCARFSELLGALSRHGFNVCVSHAHPAAYMAGQPQPTPFPQIADGKFMADLYAWKE
jgi:FkbM family methyltransferase